MKTHINLSLESEVLIRFDKNLKTLRDAYEKQGFSKKELNKIFTRSAFIGEIVSTMSEDWAVVFFQAIFSKALGIDYKQEELFGTK